eukprot:symbB.v1.2.034018.t1/scaffold4315.1/size41422/3
MPPQSVASDAAKRIKELLDEKASLERTISELKDREAARESRHVLERESQNKAMANDNEQQIPPKWEADFG